MFDYVYTDHAQYTIKTYAKMALFPLLLTGPLSVSVLQCIDRTVAYIDLYVYSAIILGISYFCSQK